MSDATRIQVRRLALSADELPELTTRIAPLPAALECAFLADDSPRTSVLILRLTDATPARPAQDVLNRLHTLGLALRFPAEAIELRVALDSPELLSRASLDSVLQLLDRVNSPSFGWALRVGSADPPADVAAIDAIVRLDHRLAACLIEGDDAARPPSAIAEALRHIGYDGPVIPADLASPTDRT